MSFRGVLTGILFINDESAIDIARITDPFQTKKKREEEEKKQAYHVYFFDLLNYS